MQTFISSKYYRRDWDLGDKKTVVIKLGDRTLDKTLQDAHVFPAIDMRKEQLDNVKPFITPRAYDEIKNGREVHEALSGIGSVGAAFSHINIWIKLADSEREDGLLIMEDDAILNEPSLSLYKKLSSMNKQMIIGGSAILNKKFQGLYAYFITPDMARTLLSRVFPLNVHIDKHLYYMSVFMDIPEDAVLLEKDMARSDWSLSTLNHSLLKVESAIKSPLVVTLILISIIMLLTCIVLACFLHSKK